MENTFVHNCELHVLMVIVYFISGKFPVDILMLPVIMKTKLYRSGLQLDNAKDRGSCIHPDIYCARKERQSDMLLYMAIDENIDKRIIIVITYKEH